RLPAPPPPLPPQPGAPGGVLVTAPPSSRHFDHEGPSGEGHPHPANRGARVTPHIRESLAHNLVHHLTLLRRQHVLGSVARDLDPDRVKARKLVGLHSQV